MSASLSMPCVLLRAWRAAVALQRQPAAPLALSKHASVSIFCGHLVAGQRRGWAVISAELSRCFVCSRAPVELQCERWPVAQPSRTQSVSQCDPFPDCWHRCVRWGIDVVWVCLGQYLVCSWALVELQSASRHLVASLALSQFASAQDSS